MADADPYFSMPTVDWGSTTSFYQPFPAPAHPPDAGTLVALPCINDEWLALLLGAADQLRNPDTWDAALSDTARADVLEQADKLRSMLSRKGPCVDPVVSLSLDDCVLNAHLASGTIVPVTNWAADFDGCVKAHVPPQVPNQPPGQSPSQNACGIATYLSLQIEKEITVKLEAARQAGQDVATYIEGILTDIAAISPLVGSFIGPVEAFFHTSTTQVVSDLTDAVNSAALWNDITCAIYSNIVSVGYVDSSNFANVGTAIAAVSFTHPWIVASLSLLWTDSGLPFWQSLQNVGSTTVGNCTGCSGPWCNKEDFTLTAGAWSIIPAGNGTYVSGTGWETTVVSGGGRGVLQMHAVGSSRTTTEVQFRVSAPAPNTLAPGNREVVLFLAGSVVGSWTFGDGTYAANTIITATFTPAVVCDTLALVWAEDGTGPAVISAQWEYGLPPTPVGAGGCP